MAGSRLASGPVMPMNLDDVRAIATGLPGVTEQPHFDYVSFRVNGRIFATVPPDGLHVHVFVPEEPREQALALYPEFVARLPWGARVVGLRVALSHAEPRVVAGLVRQAWRHKAPRRLVAAWDAS